MNPLTSAPHLGAGPAGGCPFSGSFGGHGGGASTAVVSRPPNPHPSQYADHELRSAPDGIALARLVTDHVRRTGKHFLPEPLLARLAEVRRHGAGRDPYLDAFLDCALDKYDGRFYNRTYLALPLLERLLEDPRTGLDPDRMSALLISDVIRFEIGAAEAAPHQGPGDDRPEPRTLRTRLNHALKFVATCRDTIGADGPRPRTAREPERPLADLLADLPTPPAGPAGDWFGMTVQPVYVLHDEYFFIRALQGHEMVFTVLAADLRAATCALREGSFDETVARLGHANAVFERAALLFRIVATMRATTFSAFRDFTQGASAIQSEQYKRFEIACGSPADARLRSDAFTNVPAVQADVVAGQDNLSQAYLDARRDGTFEPARWAVIDAGLDALESSHQRWKATHRGLAARMLGEASGSGYTAGVPYLQRCLSNRLFWQLGDAHLAGSKAA